jgi:aryl-alcohol dehydrogenase-like predicted oxidoreductase
MSVIGFGGYRISIRSKEHKEALINALKAGVKLIDTSSNYTNGESEKLIGEVLKEYPEFNPIIVTKAGYIQGDNLNHIVTSDDLVVISDHLKHSIHPDFLKDQLTRSLARLQKESVDVFLLHNPEYFFQIENASSEEFYQRIKKAFIY